AEAPAGVDHVLVGGGGHGVPGEHDPGDLGLHHLLHDHGDAGLGVGEALVGAVGGGPGGVHRGPAALDGVEEVVDALDVEVRVVHPGERRLGQVLGRPRRTDGDVDVAQFG